MSANPLLVPLLWAIADLEENARSAFVVCGKPDTQEGFETAWADEEPDNYKRWDHMRKLAAAAQGQAPRQATLQQLRRAA